MTATANAEQIEWITLPELARALGVCDRTVRRWVELGRLAPDHVTLGGHARFDARVVDELRRAPP